MFVAWKFQFLRINIDIAKNTIIIIIIILVNYRIVISSRTFMYFTFVSVVFIMINITTCKYLRRMFVVQQFSNCWRVEEWYKTWYWKTTDPIVNMFVTVNLWWNNNQEIYNSFCHVSVIREKLNRYPWWSQKHNLSMKKACWSI